MRSLLGDSGFAQFQEYQTTIPDRQLLESMKTSFADNPLTDDQQQRLLQIMVNERKNSIMPLDPNTGKPVVLEANPAAQMEQTLQTQDQINQRVYQQAANFLLPPTPIPWNFSNQRARFGEVNDAHDAKTDGNG